MDISYSTETQWPQAQEEKDDAKQAEELLDKMVAEASIPSLASLLKQGIENGLISPQPKYK